MKCPLGHILTYYDGSQPQYTHLRASMLAFAHINLLEMLRRFTPEEAFRVATDSVYVQKSALHRLSRVGAFVGRMYCNCGADIYMDYIPGLEYQPDPRTCARPSGATRENGSAPQQTTRLTDRGPNIGVALKVSPIAKHPAGATHCPGTG